MNDLDISKKIEECVVACARIRPGSRVIDTSEIYRIETEASPFSFLNGVYRTHIKSSSDASALIQSVFDSYKTRQLGFRWYQFPHSTPSDLGQLLEKLNPRHMNELAGLYASVGELQIPERKDVTVEELTEDNLKDYCKASNEGWGQTGAAAERIVADTRHELESGNKIRRAFLARYKGEPAGTGSLRLVENAGYLLGGSTSPKYRGKGVYSQLVRYRIELLKASKTPLALTLARKSSSAPICINLGFKVGCEGKLFEFSFNLGRVLNV